MKPAAPPENPGELAKAPERWVSLLGFVIVAKADLLAATAFLLSTITVVYQLSIWIGGPNPSLYSPETVYIFFDRYPNNRTFARFAAQVSMVNSAAVGKDVIVRDIEITASTVPKGGGKPRQITKQKWLNFVTLKRDGNRYVPEPKEAAHPLVLSGGGAVSQSVSFAPNEENCQPTTGTATCAPDRNFVTDVEFLKSIDSSESITFTVSANLVGGSRALMASCKVTSGEALLLYLAENKSFGARCAPD